jgi:mannose-1-phosphate guanylyltransferase / mannose-6-phosphate isomerase
VALGKQTLTLALNESTYIPRKVRPRFENLAEEPLFLIKVQSGDYLGEDDIMRVEDRYRRT